MQGESASVQFGKGKVKCGHLRKTNRESARIRPTGEIIGFAYPHSRSSCLPDTTARPFIGTVRTNPVAAPAAPKVISLFHFEMIFKEFFSTLGQFNEIFSHERNTQCVILNKKKSSFKNHLKMGKRNAFGSRFCITKLMRNNIRELYRYY